MVTNGLHGFHQGLRKDQGNWDGLIQLTGLERQAGNRLGRAGGDRRQGLRWV
jgi:hypothetical protein